ncbi:MAG TPA: hypothetical protein VGH73_05735 [Thermoanaerobaculia bacterium]|jgi:hypothetical protein
MKTKRPRYERETLRLQDNHGWTSREGCKIFVADRGAVRFDYPRTWVVRGDSDSIKFRDRRWPNDNCVIAMSYMRIPPIDWTGLPLAALLQTAIQGGTRTIDAWDPPVHARRFDMELAWQQGHFIDPGEKRPALTRLCIARRRTVQALLTMDFWAVDLARFSPVWDLVLETLELDEHYTDPTTGPRIM